MEYNCFACLGMNQECVNQRRYVRYGEDDDCIYFAIAKMDLDKLNKRDFQTIYLRGMLAEYLSSKGEKQKALEILT